MNVALQVRCKPNAALLCKSLQVHSILQVAAASTAMCAATACIGAFRESCGLKGTQLAGAGDKKKWLISGPSRKGYSEGEYAVVAVPSGKLHSWSFWDAIGRPRYICAPMVDQSELAFRQLVRRYGCELCYSPMVNANAWQDPRSRGDEWTTCESDRPVLCQFASHDPEVLVKVVKEVQHECDGVDLNLGCPQGIARRGRYGSWLQDEWQLIYDMVSAVAQQCSVPITVKIRVFDDHDRTLQYAKMIQDAGAAVLCVHGRTRENKGKECTPADWSLIRKIKQHLSIPVIANGNIAVFEDIQKCLDETGCDAVMSAESLRRNPALFSGRHVPGTQLAREYLALAKQFGHAPSCIRAHVMRMTLPLLNKWHDIRDLASRGDKHMTWDEYEDMLVELERRVACDAPPVVTEVRVQKDLDYDPPQVDLFA